MLVVLMLTHAVTDYVCVERFATLLLETNVDSNWWGEDVIEGARVHSDLTFDGLQLGQPPTDWCYH